MVGGHSVIQTHFLAHNIFIPVVFSKSFFERSPEVCALHKTTLLQANIFWVVLIIFKQ